MFTEVLPPCSMTQHGGFHPSDTILREMNVDNAEEARRLAEIHESAPAQWWSDYSPSPRQIELRASEFLKARQTDQTLLLVAELANEVIGFHWVDTEAPSAHIKSLWIKETHRNKGLAAKMKAFGETWARKRSLTEMKTSVHFSNRRMLDINLENGFVPGFVSLTKPLK